LKRALADYPGSVLIVSHNRDFLDPVVTKTLEFRPGEAPRLFNGNITYYLEKIAAEKEAAKGGSATVQATSKSTPGVSRKDQRRMEAEARELRNKMLKPLQAEFETLEVKIAELEGAQAALTAGLSSNELAADPDRFREATNAVAKLTDALEKAYTRWGALSEEIERIEARLNA